jgi:hypothetical protein
MNELFVHIAYFIPLHVCARCYSKFSTKVGNGNIDEYQRMCSSGHGRMNRAWGCIRRKYRTESTSWIAKVNWIVMENACMRSTRVAGVWLSEIAHSFMTSRTESGMPNPYSPWRVQNLWSHLPLRHTKNIIWRASICNLDMQWAELSQIYRRRNKECAFNWRSSSDNLKRSVVVVNLGPQVLYTEMRH